jgi:hypothetical protein
MLLEWLRRRPVPLSIADAKVHEAEEHLAASRDSASQQVVRVYNGLITSLAEYDAATASSRAAHTAYDAALRSCRQGIGTYTDLATKENAAAQGDTQVEDARANVHTAAAGDGNDRQLQRRGNAMSRRGGSMRVAFEYATTTHTSTLPRQRASFSLN